MNTGGSKLIRDMQETIKRFLANEEIHYIEINFTSMKNAVFNLVFPSPYTKYLLFGYIGLPFFETPLVIAYYFMFCLIALKKRIAKEKFFVIIVDLIEWQSTLWVKRKGRKSRFLRIFQCSLERVLLTCIADEVISLVDNRFLTTNYGIERIHDLEFVDYYVNSDPISVNARDAQTLKVLYAGDLGRGFDVEFLEDILENLNDSCKLLVAGYGMKKDLEEKLKRLHGFYFLGQLDTEKLNAVARQCQFGLIVYPPEHLYYNITSTIKLGFYIANGLTVISTNLRRTKELNDRYDFGYVLPKKEMLQLIKVLSFDKIKKNGLLQEQVTRGKFLYSTLAKLDLS